MNSEMLSTKRKALDGALQRRVRARREDSEELESINSAQPENEASHGRNNPSSSAEDDSESNSNESSEEEPEEAALVSFGALAKAEATLSGTKRKKKVLNDGNDDGWENNEAVERKAGRKDHRDFSRASKHAPTELSSKKAVSRKREVVPIHKLQARDPRFEPTNSSVDNGKIRKLYGFLDDYREDEMRELKTKIKNVKDEDEKEMLKRRLLSMEERKRAQERKDRHQAVLDRHRKEEKELVKQGKQPFYLKKTEQKKRVLLDQYGDLKGKQLDRVIERRRKKVEGKEKKNMPWTRRPQS